MELKISISDYSAYVYFQLLSVSNKTSVTPGHTEPKIVKLNNKVHYTQKATCNKHLILSGGTIIVVANKAAHIPALKCWTSLQKRV